MFPSIQVYLAKINSDTDHHKITRTAMILSIQHITGVKPLQNVIHSRNYKALKDNVAEN